MTKPRVLYAIQGTGNGHASRALEIIPYLQKYVDLDIAISGNQHQVDLKHAISYNFHGFGFVFGSKGGVSIAKTWRLFKPLKLIKEIWAFNPGLYDLVLNDFEPVTAWACKLKGYKCHSMSHQSAFWSQQSPRPKRRQWFGELVLKHYAPCTSYTGFHFQSYDLNIHLPIIKRSIRALKPVQLPLICVYLPAFAPEFLLPYFTKFTAFTWQIFSKTTMQKVIMGNVEVLPINTESFHLSLQNCTGLLTGGGFESCAEAMFLGKKLMVIPMTNQYEQRCNAEAMHLMGVKVVMAINSNLDPDIADWLQNQTVVSLQIPDKTEEIVLNILRQKDLLSIESVSM